MSRPEIWDLLDEAYRTVNRLIAHGLDRSGHPAVRASHAAVFENVTRAGSRVTDMADRAGMTKQSMGQFVRELEAAGYVERRPDPSDGRARLVLLTDRGADAVRAARRELAGLRRRVDGGLGRKQAATLHELLEQLVAILGAAEAQRSPARPPATERPR